MPRYFYECDKCGEQFKVVHGMTETQERCEICFSHVSNIRRIPQLTTTIKSIPDHAKRVKQAIEDNKEIFNEMNKEARSQTYDD
jgi:putative FmdB family regulatory protein